VIWSRPMLAVVIASGTIGTLTSIQQIFGPTVYWFVVATALAVSGGRWMWRRHGRRS